MDTDIVNINWASYEAYDPGILGSPRSLARSEARCVFQHCMETKSERLELLTRLLEANGLKLENSDSSVQKLNDWFFVHVEADPEHAGYMLPIWYSICHDIALFLGEVMIERHPNLRWEFFTWGKTNIAFQRHVIMGMRSEDPKFHTNIDINDMVISYAHRIVASRGSIPEYGTVEIRGVVIDIDAIEARHHSVKIDRDAFLGWLRRTAERA